LLDAGNAVPPTVVPVFPASGKDPSPPRLGASRVVKNSNGLQIFFLSIKNNSHGLVKLFFMDKVHAKKNKV
jgi:hypothetical protein